MLYVSDTTLYSIRSGIMSQWRFLRTGLSDYLGKICNSTEVDQEAKASAVKLNLVSHCDTYSSIAAAAICPQACP